MYGGTVDPIIVVQATVGCGLVPDLSERSVLLAVDG